MHIHINKWFGFGLAGLLFAVSAQAENWVSFGTESEGGTIYMDKDSVSRKGDLSTILVKMDNETERLQVDCKLETISSHKDGSGMVPLRGAPSERVFRRAFDVACKRTWEVWK